jgi:hypothetical protein
MLSYKSTERQRRHTLAGPLPNCVVALVSAVAGRGAYLQELVVDVCVRSHELRG